jgi:hypothetical protein
MITPEIRDNQKSGGVEGKELPHLPPLYFTKFFNGLVVVLTVTYLTLRE